MRDFENDFYELYFHLIASSPTPRIYANTNERLKEVYRHIDFKNKDVLSVMGSSDHPFSSYFLGAKSVETFDKEYLTYYYFYLRKWYLMIQEQSEYPPNFSLQNSITPKLIDACSEFVNGEEEKIALSFWKLLISRFTKERISKLFYSQSYKWNTPFDTHEDTLTQIIKDKSANFHEWDLFKEIEEKKQYEIIIVSNILEYISREEELMKIAANNLDKLLAPNGIIISTNLRGHNYGHREIFNKVFEYIEGERGYNENFSRDVPLYYVYKRQ